MIATAGAALCVDLFPRATWQGPRRVEEFAITRAYPGPRPIGSFCVRDAVVTGLDPAERGGWVHRDSGERLDLANRRLILAYGSNLDPAKLHQHLHGTVQALRAAVVGHAAVWCDARRQRDRAVVATLAPMPGWIEVHGLLAVTDDQLDRIDKWEGHPDFYRRQKFQGTILLEDCTTASDVSVYIGTPALRPPIILDGRMLRCAQYSQADVDAIVHP